MPTPDPTPTVLSFAAPNGRTLAFSVLREDGDGGIVLADCRDPREEPGEVKIQYDGFGAVVTAGCHRGVLIGPARLRFACSLLRDAAGGYRGPPGGRRGLTVWGRTDSFRAATPQMMADALALAEDYATHVAAARPGPCRAGALRHRQRQPHLRERRQLDPQPICRAVGAAVAASHHWAALAVSVALRDRRVESREPVGACTGCHEVAPTDRQDGVAHHAPTFCTSTKLAPHGHLRHFTKSTSVLMSSGSRTSIATWRASVAAVSRGHRRRITRFGSARSSGADAIVRSVGSVAPGGVTASTTGAVDIGHPARCGALRAELHATQGSFPGSVGQSTV
jgi:hypothetical protein